MTSENTYIPGVCNIGPAERRRRLRVGWMGVAFTVLVGFALFFFDAHPVWYLLLFFPATMTAAGFLQYLTHFCAYFGFAALFNFQSAGEQTSVAGEEERRKDRRKAWQILLGSVLIGGMVAGVAAVIALNV